MTMCLFSHARSQMERWEAHAAASPIAATAFRAWTEDAAVISSNVKCPSRIADMMEKKSWKTARQYCSDKKLDWRENQNEYAARRDALECRYDGGFDYRYAALNGGTDGPKGPRPDGRPGYGPYCLVMKSPTLEQAERIALVARDSLDGFLKAEEATPTVDFDALEAHVVCWEARGALAAVKLATVLEGTTEAQWPALLCRSDATDYIEVIFIREPLLLEDFAGVRMTDETAIALGVLANQKIDEDALIDDVAAVEAAKLMVKLIDKGLLMRLEITP